MPHPSMAFTHLAKDRHMFTVHSALPRLSHAPVPSSLSLSLFAAVSAQQATAASAETGEANPGGGGGGHLLYGMRDPWSECRISPVAVGC